MRSRWSVRGSSSRLSRRAVTWQMKKLNEGGGDQCILGLNFETLRPRRDVLADYKSVIDRIYTPQAYFGRVTRAAQKLDCFWPARSRPADWRGACGIVRRAACQAR